MRRLVGALIQALPDFFHVAVFLIFIFVLFAILGVHQYNGILYNRCRFNSSPENITAAYWAKDLSQIRVCTQQSGYNMCPSGQYCGNPIEYGLSLEQDDVHNNPVINFGITNFDNLGTSLLTVFQIITTDAWTPIMLNLMDADIPFLGAFYCILLVIIGSFFLMNLILAVIIQAFIKIQKQEIEQQLNKLNDININAIKPTQKSNQQSQKQLVLDQNAQPQDNTTNRQYVKLLGLSMKNQTMSNKERATLYLNQQNNFSSFIYKKGDVNLDIDPLGLQESLQNYNQPLSINDINQDRKADFSFLKKLNVKTKVLGILTGNRPSQVLKNQIKQGEQKQQINTQIGNEISGIIRKAATKTNSGISLLENQKKIKKIDTIREEDQDNSFFDQSGETPLLMQKSFKESFKKKASKLEEAINHVQKEKRISEKTDEDEDPFSNSDLLMKPSGRAGTIDKKSSGNHHKHGAEYHESDNLLISSPLTERKEGSKRLLTEPKFSLKIDSQSILENKPKFENPHKEELKLKIELMEQIDTVEKSVRSNNIPEAFKKFLDKKNEEKNQKDEFFNQLLLGSQKNNQEEIQAFGQAQMNLRQLAQKKLGIKIKRQKNNLMREVEKFKIEDRAESNKIYNFCFKLVKNQYFTQFISVLIVLNTVDLALDKYPIDEQQSQILDEINMAFSLMFMFEMIIKLLALGFKAYFKDPFNVFDCVVVLSSLIDLVVSFVVESSSGGAITALRGFRLIRIFKLAKSWKKFQNLLKTIGRTLKDISTFSILLFLFMFIYSLLGMEVFAYQAKVLSDQMTLDEKLGSSPLANFDNFVSSFTTVFIILTNDGWSAIYYNYYRVTGPAVSTIFFISLIIIGQKVLLNLFLAILLENFDEESLNQEIKEQYKRQISKRDQRNKKCKKIRKFFKCKWAKDKCIKNKSKKNSYKQDDKELKFANIQEFEIQQNVNDQSMNSSKRLIKNKQNIQDEDQKQADIVHHKNSPSNNNKAGLTQDTEPKIIGKSLSVFQETNTLRISCFKVVTNANFDYFIIFIILVSAVQLAIENPLNDPNSQMIDILYWIDFSTTMIFGLEAIMKIIAFGFYFNGQLSYLKNTWNKLDFIIITFSIISLTPLSSDFKIFKMFRVVRGLRLVGKNSQTHKMEIDSSSQVYKQKYFLKTEIRNEGLQLAVKALIQAIPQIANVTIIMLLFFLIFGIIGISYFKGKFYYCQSDFINNFQTAFVKNKWDCLNHGANWINKAYSFDNILQAMKTLFQMATTSGWSDIMFVSISTSDIDYAPELNNNLFWIFFFIAFIIVGSFFLLNLFVGVVISTFNREKDKIGGNNLLTERQKNWIDTKLIALRAKPKKFVKQPTNILRKYCFLLQKQPQFDYFILLCIILNTIVLTLKWYYQPDKLSSASEIINYIFTLIFTAEALIKLIGLGKAYFHENWNVFDFVIVIGSSLSVFLSFINQFQLGGATTIIRAFRITRIFRLVKRAKDLRLVFNTFIFTLPALANVGGLLLLLLYLYSIIGVYLFSEVKRSGILTDNLNFESFSSSFITLFSIATGDSWDQIVTATLKQKTIDFDCVSDPTYQQYFENGLTTLGCGDSAFAGLLYYYSYIIFVNLIFLNLFIAIILQGFDDTQTKESRMFNQETLDKFRDIWSEYDPEATTFIPIKQIKNFLFDIGKPLGWDETLIEKTGFQDQFIANLDLPIYNNFQDYMFFDVLQALALKLVVQEQISLEKEKKKKENQQKDSILDESYEQEDQGDEIKKEQEIKKEIEKDIDKLEFQESAQKIQAVKEVVKDQKKATVLQKNLQKDSHFTSLHQAAAQVAIQHMRYIVAKRKLIKQINQLNQVDQDEEQNFQNQVNEQNMKISESIVFIPGNQTIVNINMVERNESQGKRSPVVKTSINRGGLQEEIKVEQLSQFNKEARQRGESQKSKKSEGQGQIIQKIYQNVNINTKIITQDKGEMDNIGLDTFDDFKIFSRVSSDEIIIDDKKMNQLIESELREMNSFRSRIATSSISQIDDIVHLTPVRTSKQSSKFLKQKKNKRKKSKNTIKTLNPANLEESKSQAEQEEEKQTYESKVLKQKKKKRPQNKRIESKQKIKQFQNDSMRLGGSMGGTGDYNIEESGGEESQKYTSFLQNNHASIQEINVTDTQSSHKSQILVHDPAEIQKTCTLSKSKSHSQMDVVQYSMNACSPDQRLQNQISNVNNPKIASLLKSDKRDSNKINQTRIFGFKEHLNDKHQ